MNQMIDEIDEELEDSFVEETVSQEELEKIVVNYISRYFSDKVLNFNLHFSPNIIFSPKYINLVSRTNICDGVDMAYKSMEHSGKFSSDASDHLISQDIRYVIKTLETIKKYGIPQEYAAGILLMHLELIEGIKLLLKEI